MSDSPKPDQESRVVLVANVRPKRFHGESGEVRSGTKHFAPGAKLYFASGYWGMAGETATVIGTHRGSRKLVRIDQYTRHLRNWRVQVVYSPAVLRLLAAGGMEDRSKEDWEKLACEFRSRRYAYAFERAEDDIQKIAETWSDPSVLELLEAPAERSVVAYRDDPDTPVGLARMLKDGSIKSWVVADAVNGGKWIWERQTPEQQMRTKLLGHWTPDQ